MRLKVNNMDFKKALPTLAMLGTAALLIVLLFLSDLTASLVLFVLFFIGCATFLMWVTREVENYVDRSSE